MVHKGVRKATSYNQNTFTICGKSLGVLNLHLQVVGDYNIYRCKSVTNLPPKHSHNSTALQKLPYGVVAGSFGKFGSAVDQMM